MAHPFAELALLLVITATVGAMALRLRQPLLIAYIIVGIAVGPAGFELVRAHDEIDLLAQVGVAVLLFLVGLKLDLQHVRHIGPVALATGLGQLTFTILFGFMLVMLLGKDWVTALYVAVALTFSSTIIIIKLLSDKRELDSLHGRIAVGFLIVQDIAVVLAMLVMSAMREYGADGANGALTIAAALLGRVGIAALLLFLAMRYLLPSLVRIMARSQELLLIFAIAWGTGLAALGEWAGFSKEAGAFLAGFSLASTPYRDAMSARLSGLRDFLLLFFFIDLGAMLDFSTLDAELGTALVLAIFVLIGNPLIVMTIMGFMGYRRRTSFLAGLTVAQISEFSIVFIAMGITLGHVGQDALGLTTMVGIVTITLSTYMILHSQMLFEQIAPWLGLFERRAPLREDRVMRQTEADGEPEVVIFGLGRYGKRMLLQLHSHGIRVMGVDFDPETVDELRKRALPARFGDAEDPAFIESLPLRGASWVVTTLPDRAVNHALLSSLKSVGYDGRIAGVVSDDIQASTLREAGAERVINPFNDAADHAAEALARTIRSEENKP
ncbi:MAG: cation:proton antiporter [Pseudomonadota bacterium]